MPLSSAGNDVLANMKREYGDTKGTSVFYASMNAHKPGSEKWEPGRKKKGSPQHRAIAKMLGGE